VVARFGQVKETFWSGSAVGVQPMLTDEMVVGAEGLLGVRLPSALLQLLRVQNGGGVADTWNSGCDRFIRPDCDGLGSGGTPQHLIIISGVALSQSRRSRKLPGPAIEVSVRTGTPRFGEPSEFQLRWRARAAASECGAKTIVIAPHPPR
jgi:hypothetical protein